MNSKYEQQHESEVKFLLKEPKLFRQHLITLGAELISPRTYEKNIRFDTPEQKLVNQNKLLRLRQDDRVHLTFKGLPETITPSEVRIRKELEITASDFDTLAAILDAVGFTYRQVYEKYRQTFQLDQVEVVLDELPYGNFVELEGEAASIKAAAIKCDLDWDKRILTNYLSLMASVKAYYQLPFYDLTFDNFMALEISMDDVIQAGISSQDSH